MANCPKCGSVVDFSRDKECDTCGEALKPPDPQDVKVGDRKYEFGFEEREKIHKKMMATAQAEQRRQTFGLLLTVLAIAAFTAGAGWTIKKLIKRYGWAQAEITAGQKSLKDHKFEDAEKHFKQAMQEDGSYDRPYFFLGVDYFAQFLTEMQPKRLKRGPARAKGYYLIKMKQSLDLAAALDPKDPQIHFFLALYHYEVGNDKSVDKELDASELLMRTLWKDSDPRSESYRDAVKTLKDAMETRHRLWITIAKVVIEDAPDGYYPLDVPLVID